MATQPLCGAEHSHYECRFLHSNDKQLPESRITQKKTYHSFAEYLDPANYSHTAIASLNVLCQIIPEYPISRFGNVP